MSNFLTSSIHNLLRRSAIRPMMVAILLTAVIDSATLVYADLVVTGGAYQDITLQSDDGMTVSASLKSLTVQ